MARAIPQYNRQVIPGGLQQSPNASTVVRAQEDPRAAAMQGLIGAAGGLAQTVVAVDQQKTEDRAKVDVANTLSKGTVFWQEDFARRTQAWKPGDPDMRDGIEKDFDKWVTESEQALPTQSSRSYFRQHALNMKTKLLTDAFSNQEKQIADKLNIDTVVGIQADANVVYNSPEALNEVYTRRAESIRVRTDLSEAEKLKQMQTLRQELYLAKERGEVERDPEGWYRARYGDPGQAQAGAPGTGQGAAGSVQPQPRSYDVAMSIFGQESSHGKADTSKFNSQNVTGPMQIQQGTFDGMKRLGIIPQNYNISNPEHNKDAGFKWVDYLYNKYNGDAAKVAAAYYGGEKAVRPDGTIRREMGNKSRPQDPTVGQYVDQVLRRMGRAQGSGEVQGQGPAPQAGAPMSFTGIDWQSQSTLRKMAETKIKQGEAANKAQVQSDLNNLTAMHKDGKVEATPMAPEVFDRAFGVQGPAMYAQYQKSREMGGIIGGMKTQTNAEIMAAVEAARPDENTPDYAAADQRFATVVSAANQTMKMRNADPAGYAASNNTDLTAQRAVLADPATSAEDIPALQQKYVRDNLAEQQRLGIAQPKILTPAQVDSIAMQAMQAKRPEDSANLINGLQQQYGDYFPQMFGELVNEGKISGELLIIPNLDSAVSRELVSSLARVKEADLSIGVEAADIKTVKDEAVVVAGDLARTFPRAQLQGAQTLDAYNVMTRKVAYQLMANGMSAGDAVESARDMLLGKYDIDGTIRFPKGTDTSAVYRGIESKMNQIQDQFDLPEDESRGRDEDALLNEWQNTVRSRGKWYTNDNDDGVELWASGANGLPHRVTVNGEPVSFTFDQLETESASSMKDANNPVRAAFGVSRRTRTTED